MKLEKILYQKVFPLSSYVNERIGVEISIDPTDNSDEVFKQAKAMVERWHEENNPHLAMQPEVLPEVQLRDKSDEVDQELQKFMAELATFPYEDAAKEFLVRSAFKFYRPAHQFIEEKFKK